MYFSRCIESYKFVCKNWSARCYFCRVFWGCVEQCIHVLWTVKCTLIVWLILMFGKLLFAEPNVISLFIGTKVVLIYPLQNSTYSVILWILILSVWPYTCIAKLHYSHDFINIGLYSDIYRLISYKRCMMVVCPSLYTHASQNHATDKISLMLTCIQTFTHRFLSNVVWW